MERSVLVLTRPSGALNAERIVQAARQAPLPAGRADRMAHTPGGDDEIEEESEAPEAITAKADEEA